MRGWKIGPGGWIQKPDVETWNKLFGHTAAQSYSSHGPDYDYEKLFKAIHIALLAGKGTDEVFDIFEEELLDKKLEPLERLAIRAKLQKEATK